MDLYEAFMIVAVIAGAFGFIFLVGAFVSDLFIPWVNSLWHRRTQARYRNNR